MKKIIERLLKKLVCDDDVNNLNIYKSNNNSWIYYYDISGEYKGNSFHMCIRKSEALKSVLEIYTGTKPFQEYLKTITELQFKIK
jgi:hypothetical protein